MDQQGKGASLSLASCSLEELCPVRAMHAYLGLWGKEQGYFFIHRDGSPLTKYQFWRMTDLALDKVGIQGLKFGTHSFRVGAASTAAALGYEPDINMLLQIYLSTP